VFFWENSLRVAHFDLVMSILSSPVLDNSVQGFGSVRTGKRGASQGGRSSDSSKVRIAAPVLGLPRTSEGKKEAGVEFVVVRKNPGLNRARMSYGRWVSRPRNICIIPGIPTPRKGHPRAGFQSSPRGYEELYNPVRAAILYK
jgi:hypothetical protein